MNADEADDADAAALPFKVIPRALPGGGQGAVLEYEGTVRLPQGVERRVPLRIDCGDVSGDPRLTCNPLGRCILDLIRMYREQESRRSTLLRENEELRRKLSAEQGKVGKLTAQVNGYRRQKESAQGQGRKEVVDDPAEAAEPAAAEEG